MLDVSKGYTDIFTVKCVIKVAQQCSSNVSDSNRWLYIAELTIE